MRAATAELALWSLGRVGDLPLAVEPIAIIEATRQVRAWPVGHTGTDGVVGVVLLDDLAIAFQQQSPLVDRRISETRVDFQRVEQRAVRRMSHRPTASDVALAIDDALVYLEVEVEDSLPGGYIKTVAEISAKPRVGRVEAEPQLAVARVLTRARRV